MGDSDERAGDSGGLRELGYARADLERLTIERVDGGVLVRIPPAGTSRFAVRVGLWALGLALVGVNVAHSAGLRVPRAVLILTSHLMFLPVPARVIMGVVCAMMVYRIVRHRRDGARVGFDGERVFVVNPSGLLRRREVGLERVWMVLAKDTLAGPCVMIVLRDGVASRVTFDPGEDARAVRDALEGAMGPAPDRAAPERGAAMRTWESRQWEWVPKSWPRARCEEYTDGVRVTFTGDAGWLILGIVRAGFFFWLMVALLAAAGLALPVFVFMQCTAVYALCVMGLYISELESKGPDNQDRPRPAIDVVGGRVFLADRTYRGPENGWAREEVKAIGVGGPLWWILRVGALKLWLRSGKVVTLAYGYPISVIRSAAGEIRRGMEMGVGASAGGGS